MIQKFEFKETKIAGLMEITPFNADDVRGSFTKDYSKEVFEQNGISHDLQEVFYTTSHKGVIRALHFQREKQQPKLVRWFPMRPMRLLREIVQVSEQVQML